MLWKINPTNLPVMYRANCNAWMTLSFFQEWLMKLNQRMKIEKRKILMFLDNSSTYKVSNQDLFSNVKLIFFPPNATSVLQPLDQGVIQNFKIVYRKLMIRRILCEMDQSQGMCIELAQKISVFDAIQMMSLAWKSVEETTITKCFIRSEFIGFCGKENNIENDNELNLILSA